MLQTPALVQLCLAAVVTPPDVLKVTSAVPPSPAPFMAPAEFFVERDSAAFRALVAKVMSLGGLEIEDGWIEDGDVQVFKFVTKPV